MVNRLTKFLSVFALSVCAPLVGIAAEIPVPSGQPVTFHEVIWEQEGDKNTYRFRYIAPEIARNGGSIKFDQVELDLHYLCEKSALVELQTQGRKVDTIIVSLSDVAVEFGKTDPKVTQYIDAYTADGIRCIWEGF